MRGALVSIVVLVGACAEPEPLTIVPDPVTIAVEPEAPVEAVPVGAIEVEEVAPPANVSSLRSRTPRHPALDDDRPRRVARASGPRRVPAAFRTNGAPPVAPPPPAPRGSGPTGPAGPYHFDVIPLIGCRDMPCR